MSLDLSRVRLMPEQTIGSRIAFRLFGPSTFRPAIFRPARSGATLVVLPLRKLAIIGVFGLKPIFER